MQLSEFGHKFANRLQRSAIVELMEDLGEALNENPNIVFMGGGNPARINALEQLFEQQLHAVLADNNQRHALLGIYQSPQGDSQLRSQLADFLNREHGWALKPENIAVSNGSQAAFFVLFNLFAGVQADGSRKRIQLPLAPEYLGYADTGLSEPFFTASKPTIEHLPRRQFKYHVDFEALAVNSDSAALCVSRPTNPTGNVLTDNEISKLSLLAQQNDIPLIIDGAYGTPFPNIIFEQAQAHWDNNTILALSLSKLGLPGARTGFVIGREDIIEAYTSANTIINLACGNLGPALAKSLLSQNQLKHCCQAIIKPYYLDKLSYVVACCEELLEGLPYRLHKPEGAIFLWLWFEHLPISTQELYQRLKAQNLLIIPGEPFFVGLDNNTLAGWEHSKQCIRISYAQPPNIIKQGFNTLARELKNLYN